MGSYYEELARRNGVKIPSDAMVTRRALLGGSHNTKNHHDRHPTVDSFTGKRTCAICRIAKDVSDFALNDFYIDGIDRQCKDCRTRGRADYVLPVE